MTERTQMDVLAEVHRLVTGLEEALAQLLAGGAAERFAAPPTTEEEVAEEVAGEEEEGLFWQAM